MKLFRTSDREVIKFCQSTFNFVLLSDSVQIAKRTDKFVKNSTSSLCHDYFVVLCVLLR